MGRTLRWRTNCLPNIWLRHARTLADIDAQHLLPRPGIYVIVHNDREEIFACLEWAIDDADSLMPEVRVARPLDSEEVAQLHTHGAQGRRKELVIQWPATALLLVPVLGEAYAHPILVQFGRAPGQDLFLDQ